MKIPTQSLAWRTNQPCHGVIVHEDATTERRAENLWNQLVDAMGNESRSVAFHRTAEQVTKSPEFERAEAANLMILSVHDLSRFVMDAAEWLNDWLNAPSTEPRALFVLHDGHEDNRVMSMLRKIAESAGVTLVPIAAEEPAANPIPSLWWINFG